MSSRATLLTAVTASMLSLPLTAQCDPPSLLDRAVVRSATRLAVARAGLDVGGSRALASRARNAAWLPQLSVRVARNTGASTTQYTAATGDRQLLDDSLYVDVRVSLSLDRLVFDPNETTLWRIDEQRTARRLHLEREVFDALVRCERLRRARPAPIEGAPVDPRWELDYLVARARVEQFTGVALEALEAR
jgi:hypothetical protein